MVALTAKESCDRARRQTTCVPGLCLAYTRTWLGIDPRETDAISAWNAAEHRHPGEIGPAGAPMFWSGGSEGHGHIDLSMGPRVERTTDAPGSGQVSSVPHGWIDANWSSQNYMGWTEDLNGITIPYLDGDDPDWRSKGNVRVALLHTGAGESRAASRLRFRLNNHAGIPSRLKPPMVDDAIDDGTYYGPLMADAVRYWQRHIIPDAVPGPRDGASMSDAQARRLFGDRYNVIEK